jgi:RNA polymerase sigma-70 factor (ECF subfamily)
MRQDYSISDEIVYQQYLDGNTGSFTILYDRYANDVWTLIMSIIHDTGMADDLTQDTFLKLHTRGDQYAAKSKLKSWLLKIAYNTALDYRKHVASPPGTILRKASSIMAEENGLDVADRWSPPVDSSLIYEEEHARVEAAILKLFQTHREALVMAYFMDMTGHQMADLWGIPLGTVKSRLHAAMRSFREVWEQDFQEAA